MLVYFFSEPFTTIITDTTVSYTEPGETIKHDEFVFAHETSHHT